MNKKRYGWGYSPTKSTTRIDDKYKKEILDKSMEFINSKIKPRAVNEEKISAAKKHGFNYTVDVYSKWYRDYFYFCTKCKNDSPNAIQAEYEDKFARLKYIDKNRFNVSYMRHTGQWFELYPNVTFDEALKIIEKDPNFMIM